MTEAKPDADVDFLTELENGVLDILGKKSKSTKNEKLAAINAGVKLLAIRHKIKGGDDEGFFG